MASIEAGFGLVPVESFLFKFMRHNQMRERYFGSSPLSLPEIKSGRIDGVRFATAIAPQSAGR
jgi:hypothetical protein